MTIPRLPLSAKGYNGTVSFDGRTVTIERRGFDAWLAQGLSKKSIPLSRIRSVQYYPGNWARSGYVRFTVAGDEGARNTRPDVSATAHGRAVHQADDDPNAVLIHGWTSKQEAFKPLVAAIEAALSE